MLSDAYASEYSEEKLWRKVLRLPPLVSRRVLRQVLTLYVMLTDPGVPAWAKTTIVGGLGYLICPLDAYFDFLPGGLLDDIAVLSLVLAHLAAFRGDAIHERVRELEATWRPADSADDS